MAESSKTSFSPVLRFSKVASKIFCALSLSLRCQIVQTSLRIKSDLRFNICLYTGLSNYPCSVVITIALMSSLLDLFKTSLLVDLFSNCLRT